jgi:uncharacterized membrane protein YkvA (DUF1232 family)
VSANIGQSEDLASSGLLSFYDRLRARIVKVVARKGGRLGAATSDALLLVPDVFILLARLALDREVPRATRSLVAGALAYFVLPLDFFPEGVVGVAGFVDDLVLACAVLSQVLGDDLEAVAQQHWSGSDKLRRVLGDVTKSANSLLGDTLYRRVKGLLARRGIDIGTIDIKDF